MKPDEDFLRKRRESIVSIAGQNPAMTMRQIASRLGMTIGQVEADIRKMRKDGNELFGPFVRSFSADRKIQENLVSAIAERDIWPTMKSLGERVGMSRHPLKRRLEDLKSKGIIEFRNKSSVHYSIVLVKRRNV